MSSTYSRYYLEGITKNASTPFFKSIEDIYKYYYEGDTSAVTNGWLNEITELKLYERVAYYSDKSLAPSGGVLFNAWGNTYYWTHPNNVTVTSNMSMYEDIKAALESINNPAVLSYAHATNLRLTERPDTVPEISVGEFMQKCVNSVGATMWQDASGKLFFTYPSRSISDYTIPLTTSYSYPEIELGRPLRRVKIVDHYKWDTETTTKTFDVNSEGEDIIIDNPYRWGHQGSTWDEFVANKYIEFWKPRGWVSGEFRADPRLELFDVISVESKHGLISPVMITRIKYTYNGSFRGEYKGKILSEDWMTTTAEDGEV